jgi:acetyl esterase/lipase
MPGPSPWGYRPGADVADHWDDYADNARGAGYHGGKVQSTGRKAMQAWFLIAFAMLMSTAASAQQHEVMTRANVDYVEHDGAKLSGDLYLPKGVAKAPVVIAIHGGGWQGGSPAGYQHWGPYLARNGYGMFAIKYRLAKPGIYPRAVYDVRSAIQFVRAKAAELGVDADRIGLWGDSAGGHLAALAGLAADTYTAEYSSDPHAAIAVNVKTVVGFYGVYDMLAQWHHDQIARPRDQIAEKFLGASPMQNRKLYFESSPISYATIDRNKASFMLVNGTADDIVDPEQSQQFWQALNQAGIYSRRIVIPGAGHFFASDPHNESGSFSGLTAPRILRFLQERL